MTTQSLMPASTNSRDRLKNVWNSNERLRYLVLGLWNTAFAYLAYFALYGLFHLRIHYLIVSLLVHLAAVTNAFICQRIFVFRSKTSWLAAFLRFNMVQLVVLIASIAGLALLVEGCHVDPLVSQLIVMTGCVIVGYLLNRGFSFKVGKP